MDRGLVLYGLDQLAALGVDLLAHRRQRLAAAFDRGLLALLASARVARSMVSAASDRPSPAGRPRARGTGSASPADRRRCG